MWRLVFEGRIPSLNEASQVWHPTEEIARQWVNYFRAKGIKVSLEASKPPNAEPGIARY